MSYGPQAMNLVIPAANNNAEVVSEVTVGEEATIVYAQPHMHVRGKDFELRVIYPTGESETIRRNGISTGSSATISPSPSCFPKGRA